MRTLGALQDVIDKATESGKILEAFKEFLEDKEGSGFRKVWHNYGFDRHVLSNMGVNCGGFAGDTQHMARIHDASRKYKGGYSLESLSSDAKVR